jgi:hypothetical protein
MNSEIKPNTIKRIIQFDLDGNYIATFASGTGASRATGFSNKGINKCCLKLRKQHRGFQWRYEDEVGSIKKISSIKYPHKPIRQVVQFDIEGNYIDTFESAGKASKMTGILKSAIYGCCSRKYKGVREFQWRYEDEVGSIKKISAVQSSAKSVVQFDLEGNYIYTFESAKKASKISGICQSGIYSCCKGKYKTSGGFKWRFEDEVGDMKTIPTT